MTYFISYHYTKLEENLPTWANKIIQSDFGNDTFNTSKEIESIEDIQEIEILLTKKHQYESVTILNYRLI